MPTARGAVRAHLSRNATSRARTSPREGCRQALRDEEDLLSQKPEIATESSQPEQRGARHASEAFHALAAFAAQKFGSPWAFVVALALIVVWAATGPIFDFNETWQLVINTGTTIITFLMVFLIQATQNWDSRAVHLKLDELIRASSARNAFADLEDASEAELDAFHEEFRLLRKRGVEGADAARKARAHARRRSRPSRS
jgi:low affinity Fe/Cu permease